MQKKLTRRSGEQLITQNLDGVEPVQRLRVRAIRNALALVALTEIPQPNLVEIVQPQCLRNGVDQGKVGHRRRDDIAEVEADEVPVAQQRLVVCAADLQENEEDDSDEQEEGCDQGEGLACPRCSLELRFSEFWVALLDCCGGRVLRPATTEETHASGVEDPATNVQ